MAAGSKEKEPEDTLPDAEQDAVSAEASELRRRLLAVGSNDNAERQRASGAASGVHGAHTAAGAAVQQQHADERDRALRATAQFVRRRRVDTSDEPETITALSGVPLPRREEATLVDLAAHDAAPRPSRARIVLPFVAGALLVVVALIHRSLDEVQASVFAGARPAAASMAPAPLHAPERVEHGVQSLQGGAAVAAPSVRAPASADIAPASAASPLAKPPASPADEAVRLLDAARAKTLARAKPAASPRAAASAAPPSAPAPEPAVAAAPEPAAPAPPAPAESKPRPRLVEDGARPTLLD
jgi:hypothetical protein